MEWIWGSNKTGAGDNYAERMRRARLGLPAVYPTESILARRMADTMLRASRRDSAYRMDAAEGVEHNAQSQMFKDVLDLLAELLDRNEVRHALSFVKHLSSSRMAETSLQYSEPDFTNLMAGFLTTQADQLGQEEHRLFETFAAEGARKSSKASAESRSSSSSSSSSSSRSSSVVHSPLVPRPPDSRPPSRGNSARRSRSLSLRSSTVMTRSSGSSNGHPRCGTSCSGGSAFDDEARSSIDKRGSSHERSVGAHALHRHMDAERSTREREGGRLSASSTPEREDKRQCVDLSNSELKARLQNVSNWTPDRDGQGRSVPHRIRERGAPRRSHDEQFQAGADDSMHYARAAFRIENAWGSRDACRDECVGRSSSASRDQGDDENDHENDDESDGEGEKESEEGSEEEREKESVDEGLARTRASRRHQGADSSDQHSAHHGEPSRQSYASNVTRESGARRQNLGRGRHVHRGTPHALPRFSFLDTVQEH